MAQENTLRKDSSMDDILSSIRRIIDESEARKVEMPDGPSAPANDIAPSSLMPKADIEPAIMRAPTMDEAESLESVLAKLDAEIEGGVAVDQPTEDINARAAKYEARFSAEDSKAFATVGDVLAEHVAMADVADEVEDDHDEMPEHAMTVVSPTVDELERLVSEPVAHSVSRSFGQLEELFGRHSEQSLTDMTKSMLKPMLQEWLDENLPSMVERMVRSEIERIARGEPRQS